MRVHIETFGCQMNKLDSELVLGKLLQEGCSLAPKPSQADVIIINTCSVRRHAEERAYSRIRSLSTFKEKKPDLVIAVIGCMAQKDKEDVFRRAPHVDIVCGPGEIDRLPDIIAAQRNSQIESRLANFPLRCIACDISSPPRFERMPAARSLPFQAFVAVVYGCNNFCSYCVVPYLRGRQTSRPAEEIINEVKILTDDGVKEITLLGQNVTSYGKDLHPPKSLAKLLTQLQEVPGIERIRFVTSHPCDVTEELLDAMCELPKVCGHLHVPAQSGSDRILERMNRGYSNADYRRMVELARDRVPDIEIASDFIVGFPGETEEDFQATVELVRWAEFQNSFVFKYSRRPGTKAAELPDDVPIQKKKERNNVLLSVQEEISFKRHRRMLGKSFEVLVEGASKRNPNRLTGRTRGNHIVVFDTNPGVVGRLVNVLIEDCTSLTLFGRLVQSPSCVNVPSDRRG